MKKIIGAFVLLLFVSSCRNVRPVMSPDAEQMVLNHKKIAVLPFEVKFSEEYKKMIRQSATPWAEQERIAGIDLQKTGFEYFAKRSAKKNYELIIQDFMTTNKTLEQLGIPFSQLMVSDKSRIASLLGVDAVIFGQAQVEFDRNRGFMGTNGIRTTLNLYDAQSGQSLWSGSDHEYIRSAFDSPQDLAKRSLSNLVNALPYKSKK